MISRTAIQKILGINEDVSFTVEEMASKCKVVFYPPTKKASEAVISFARVLKESLIRLNVTVLDYEEIWTHVSIITRCRRFLKYFLNNILWILKKLFQIKETGFYIPFSSILKLSSGKRIKKGICIICIGEQDIENLAMQYITNFKDNSIITIVDFPKNINEESHFFSHFDTSMSLFAYHMTNIILAVDDSKWMIYNFNASHPIYSLDKNLDRNIQKALIPKIVAPISPHKFAEFLISNKRFDTTDKLHASIVTELKNGAQIFSKTELYPKGKKIDELPFRHNFHKLIGKLHLDNRSGMSFGFIAFQMPTALSEPVLLSEFQKINKTAFTDSDLFVGLNSEIFVLINVKNQQYVLKIPDIWVMTLRSGSDKTNFDPKKDLLKLGLINGKMYMEFPVGLKIDDDYKPSFDTKVILAHAVGNSIIASVLKKINTQNKFPDILANKGISISHWHGYFNKKYRLQGVNSHGEDNPHVSCSSPQSAIFALNGKLSSFCSIINSEELNHYNGDIHVEPHHGINVSYPSLVDLATYIVNNPESTKLGNIYLN